jgi:RimJ/RimL family protein N-acetyltransferase
MSIYIETDRLYIRELEPRDEAGMFLMDSDPEVHRYLGNNPVKTPAEVGAVIEFVRRQYAEAGIGRWAVLEKDTGDFVGWTGFKLMRERVNGRQDFYDFGYRHTRKHWGKGYATEAARAALDYGIDRLGFTDVYAMTDIDNGASRHILEGLGFRLQEIFPYDAEPNWRAAGAPTTWYKLDQRTY